MQDNTSNNKRIAKNTLMLYIRMLLLMLISLYTSRVILNVLGIEDYGIYNVVGGVVTMFSMISASLNSAISRFITYELGSGNKETLNRVFSSSVTIQIGIASFFLLIAETLGMWFLNNKMVIPETRLVAARWCLHLSALTFAINLISVPYNSAIIAHEKMSAFAYISIFEAMGKLIVAWIISFSPIDKLIFYATLLAVIAIIVRMIYMQYCKRHFEECTYKFVYDLSLLNRMFGFAGWNMIGTSSAILRDQGGDILINLFFGPVVNGAKAIATQVNSAINGFVQNFMLAMNPQITKSYASGNNGYMHEFVMKGAKYSYFILLLIGLPFLLNTEFVLQIWLKMVPDHAVLFVQLAIILAMCDCLSHTLVAAILAEGEIKSYMALVGALQLLNVPIAYIALTYGCIPEVIIMIAIVISQICLVARLLFLRHKVNLSIREFIIKVYLNVIIVTLLAAILPFLLYVTLEQGWLALIAISTVSVLCTSISVLYVGLNKFERQSILNKIWTFSVKFL